MLPVLLASSLFLQTLGARGQPTPSATPAAELVVVMSAAIYQPDGAVMAETAQLPANGAGLIHMFARKSVCEPAIAGATEPSDAGFGWRINSQIVSRSEKEIVVSLDWKRLWDAGRKTANGPGGTVQLTLHPGDRIPLDHITNSSPKPECRAVGLGLDVRLARAATPTTTPASLIPLGATPGGAKPVDAELWLMHTLPSGTVQVLHQTVRVPAAGGQFGFASTAVETARGKLNVQMSGSIDRYRTPAGTEFLILSLSRLVTGEGLPANGVSSSTSSVQAMPSTPVDVLSFEIPGTVGRGGGGGRGGAGAARGGLVGNTGGTMVSVASGGGGAGAGSAGTGRSAADPQSGAATGGQRGAGGSGVAAGGRGGGVVSIAPLLEGHQFALRVRITQIN